MSAKKFGQSFDAMVESLRARGKTTEAQRNYISYWEVDKLRGPSIAFKLKEVGNVPGSLGLRAKYLEYDSKREACVVRITTYPSVLDRAVRQTTESLDLRGGVSFA